MTLQELTDLANEALDDLKARDIKMIDVAEVTAMTERMLVATGTSQTHVKAIARNVIDAAKKAGQRPRGIEGLEQSEWVLVDLGDIVVHVMQAQTRAFYQLEKLWETRMAGGEEESASSAVADDSGAQHSNVWARGPQ